MSQTVTEAAFKLTGIGERRARARSLLGTLPDLELASLSPAMDWFALTTADYLGSPPLCYYWEPAFEEYARVLRSLFGSPKEFVAEAAQVGGLTNAILRAEHLAYEIAAEDLSTHQMTVAVRRYLARWYLDLCDQVLDVLLLLPAHALAKRSGKQTSKKLVNIVQFLEKAGWTTAGEAYSSTVRNGIAHELTFETEFAGRNIYAVFADDRGNTERRTLDELKNDVELLADRSLGYALAVRLYLLEYVGEEDVACLLDPTLLTPEVRERGLRGFASTSGFTIDAASIDTVAGRRQLTVQATDSSDHDGEQLVHIIGVLHDAALWFPDAERIVVGTRGKGRLAALVTVDGSSLRSWVSGEISDQAFWAKTENTLFPFGRRVGRWRHKVRYVGHHVRQEWERRRESLQTGARLRLLSAQDISTALARRYSAEAILEDTASEELIRRALCDAVQRLRGIVIHKNQMSRKRWRRTRPHYISVFLYAREKRRRDRWADTTSAFYLGRAEYRDPDFHGQLPDSSLPESASPGLTLDLSPNWHRARAPVPLSEESSGN